MDIHDENKFNNIWFYTEMRQKLYNKGSDFWFANEKYGEMGGDNSHMAAFSCYNTPFFSEICKGIFNVEVFGYVETRNQFVSMVLYSVL